jgi:hypothetical protein
LRKGNVYSGISIGLLNTCHGEFSNAGQKKTDQVSVGYSVKSLLGLFFMLCALARRKRSASCVLFSFVMQLHPVRWLMTSVPGNHAYSFSSCWMAEMYAS